MRLLNSIAFLLTLFNMASAQEGTGVITFVSSEELVETVDATPRDRVSDIAIKQVATYDGSVGIGVLHRPVMKATSASYGAIVHHNLNEVYRIMKGKGILVTSTKLSDARSAAPDSNLVINLTGPSDFGRITEGAQYQSVKKGDMVIIPAGVAHGFSEITEAIDYMVVRIDPENLLALK